MTLLQNFKHLSDQEKYRMYQTIERLLKAKSLQQILSIDQPYYETAIQFRNHIQIWLSIRNVSLVIDEYYGVIFVKNVGDEFPLYVGEYLKTAEDWAIFLTLHAAQEEARRKDRIKFYKIAVSELRSRCKDEYGICVSDENLEDTLRKLRSCGLADYQKPIAQTDASITVLPLMFLALPENLSAVFKALFAPIPEELEDNKNNELS